METKNIDEPQFEHEDPTPAPETENTTSKLDQLNPQELIPAKLANIPQVIGSTKVVTHKSKEGIDYIITDDGQITSNQIKNGFEYFDEESLEKYPELRIGKNEYVRPLAHGNIKEISPDILFNGIFETNPALRGKGLGLSFQEHIAELAKKLGYKFLAGYQVNAETARFFLKRGRYLLEEIKDELQPEFQNIMNQGMDETAFHTVKFLTPEDIARYIKPERIGTAVEDKIEFKQKILTLDDVFYKLAETLKKVEEEKEEAGDRATLIEIMEDLNQILPADEQYDLPEISEDDNNLVLDLKALLEHLKSKSDTLIQEATLEQLEENII